MPHSLTHRTPSPDRSFIAFNVLESVYDSESRESMEECVDDLRAALIDAEVILSRLRDEELGLLDATDDETDVLDRIWSSADAEYDDEAWED